MLNRIVIVVIFCYVFALNVYAGKLNSDEKAKYASPKPVTKRKFQVNYQGLSRKIPKDLMKYGKITLLEVSGRNSRNVSLIFREKDKYLNSVFSKIPPDSTVTLYGTLRRKHLKKGELNYFMIDDAEIYTPVSGISRDSEGNINTNFSPEDYKKLSLRAFKIDFPNLIDKKICLQLHVRNIRNRVATPYQKLAGMTVQKFYVIDAVLISGFDLMEPQGMDVEPLGVDVIVPRDNNKIAKVLTTTLLSDDFLFYGRLKKLQDPTNTKIKPVYFFILDGLAAKSE